MIKILLILFFFLLRGGELWPQQISRDPSLMVTGSGFMNLRTVEPELEGKIQLFDEFKATTIYLKGRQDPIKMFVNFDLYNNVMVIDLRGQLFEVLISQIDSAVVKAKSDSIVSVFNLSGVPGIKRGSVGTYLFKGQRYQLIKEFNIEVIKPTYNELMNVGNRNYVIKNNPKYYLRESDDLEFRQFQITRNSFRGLDSDNKNRKLIQSISLQSDADIIMLLKRLSY